MSRVATVAIIGGGVSGLSAGSFLSQRGVRVQLFEATDKLGGCCATSDIGGYVFPDGALYVALPGFLDHVFERLGLDRPSLVPLRKITANMTTELPGGVVVTIGDGLDVRVERPNGVANGAKLQKELDTLMKRWTPILNLFTDDLFHRPFSTLRFVLKGWRHIPKLRGTVASELYRLFSDEAVRATLSGSLLYLGSPPEKLPASQMLVLAAMLGEGNYVPEGGIGKVHEALSQPMRRNGGEISLNARVSKILIRDGRAYGVEVDGRGVIETDAVLSTTSGMSTFAELMDAGDVPEEMRKHTDAAPLSIRVLRVQLGLSNKINARTHFNHVLPMMEEQYQCFRPETPERWLSLYVPTVTTPDLAPPGGSVVEMFPPIAQDGPIDAWDEQRTERIAEAVIKAVSERYDMDVVVKRILGPKDFRDAMYRYKGAINGLSPTADPRAWFPHVPRVRGLYLAGESTYPGFGIAASAMSGIFAAEALLRS